MNELTLKDAIKELEELSTGDWVPYEYSPEEAKLILNHINNLQSQIDKANELLEEILVVSDWEHEGRFRPVKGTTAQDVYKTIVKLNELLETPRRTNYELLKEDK